MSILAMLSLYMLYGVRYSSKSSKSEVMIASIVEQIKTVKRKRDFYQSWMDVNPGESLSLNDEIYTHGQSSAKIHFDNGLEINLFENSLLRIKKSNKENSLNLERGNLTAKLSKKSPKLDVVLSGKKYSFESQNANIQIEQGEKENKFILLKGKATLNINEVPKEIKENQVLIQNKKSGDVNIKELPFILNTPLHNSVSYFKDEISIPFSWNYTSLATPATIIISESATFKEIVHQSTIVDNHTTHVFTKSGIYYWKLVSSDGLEGPIRTLTLMEEMPPLLKIDRDFVYLGPKKAENVFLSWPQGNAQKFLIRIQSPNEKTQEREVLKNNYELAINQVGTYKISVKVLDVDRPKALWSDPVSISAVEAKAISIISRTPELIEKVNYSAQLSNHLLSWDGPNSGVNYTIKLTNNNKTEIFNTENLSLPLTFKDPGEYVWEIKGETESGIISNSISGKIIIKKPLNISQTPSEGAVIELEKPDQLVAFKWEKILNIDEYTFELSSDAQFQKLIYEKDIATNNLSTALAKTGKYYWRVRIKNGSVIEYSSPVSVEIKPTPPLSKPGDLPSIKIKLKYKDDQTSSIHFHWLDYFISKAEASLPAASAEWDLPSNSRAKEYIVEIFKEPTLINLVARIVTEKPHIVWENATPGNFYWRVSYVDFWGRKTEFSKASPLTVEIDQNTLPIELNSPKHHQEILEKIDDEFNFSWMSLPGKASYQLLIDTGLDFVKPIFKLPTSTNEIKIKCQDLKNTENDYFWKVITPLGNSSKRRLFHAKCTPPVIEPPHNFEISQSIIAEEEVKEKKPQHYAKLGLFPHHLTYTNNSNQYTAKVSGNAINSFFALYNRPLETSYFKAITPSLLVSRGKVFNTITFTDYEMNLKAARSQSQFTWGPVIAIVKKTLYVESNLAINAESALSPLLGVFIKRELSDLTMNAELKFGGMLNYHADLQYVLKKRMMIGPFLEGTSLKKESSKHSFFSLGLNLSYIFPFLETEK